MEEEVKRFKKPEARQSAVRLYLLEMTEKLPQHDAATIHLPKQDPNSNNINRRANLEG